MAEVESKHNALYKLLHGVTVKDVMPANRQIVTLRASDPVEKAVLTLSENKILSAPVFDESGECVGFIDMLDIIKYVASVSPSKSALLKKTELQSLKIAGRAIALMPLSQVVNLSEKDAFVTVQVDQPASSVVELFSSGVHRAAVFRKDELVGVVSQSDIARFLSQHLHMGNCKHIGQKTIAELGYGAQKIETVPKTALVVDVVKKFSKKGVSALAVIDPDTGRLVGNFSASNFRGLYQHRFPFLLDSVENFLLEHSPSSLQPIVGEPRSTLIDTVKELVESKLHHMWVVEDFKPVGIISLTDVMRIITS